MRISKTFIFFGIGCLLACNGDLATDETLSESFQTFPSPAADASPSPSPVTIRLNALHHSLSLPGSELVLEGAFQPSVTVSFPGAISVPATFLGPNRVSVAVPSSVTNGLLSVLSSGIRTRSLPFRSLQTPAQLGAFDEVWSDNGLLKMATARAAAASLVVGKWLYVFGGFALENMTPAVVASIERAPINSDGSLGAFSAAGQIGQARSGHAAVRVGDWIYMIGGYGETDVAPIERAKVNANDSLSAFSPVTVNGRPIELSQHGMSPTTEIIGDYLYVLGGIDDNGTAVVERAPILDSKGAIGAFRVVSGLSYRTPRVTARSEVVGSYLYVCGGKPVGAYDALADCERAKISGNGRLSNFAAASVAMTTPRAFFHSVTLGGYWYAIAGETSVSHFIGSVERAKILPNGELAPFEAVSSTLRTARIAAMLNVIGDYVYLYGGDTDNWATPFGERAAIQ